MNKEYIDLQSCNATQISESGVKGDWSIKKNVTGDVLSVFPASVSDKVMFSIMDFAKKYELIAFNAGINFQKGKENEVLASNIVQLKRTNNALAEENSRLATALDYQTSHSEG